MAKYVITGVSQGIGRFLHEQLGGIGLTRQNASQLLGELRANGEVDAVIHCAFNSMKTVSSEIIHAYYCDNILLTELMLSIPHRKFCFFSSVDVYEKDQRIKTEDQVIHIERGINPYGFTKLVSESLVLAKSHEPLILRPTQMLGNNRRPNVLTRLMQEERASLPLSADSVLNCILYADVLAFVRTALAMNLTGVFNLASSANITLAQVASHFDRKPFWGVHRYDIGRISNTKVCRVTPGLCRTTLQVIRAHFFPTTLPATLAGVTPPRVDGLS